MRLMPERQCRGCRRQEEWGCEAELVGDPALGREAWRDPAMLPLTVDDEDIYCCPRQNIHRRPAEWGAMLKYYSMYKNGFLPQPGATMDQSNYAVEVFRVFDDVNHMCDVEQMKRPPEDKPTAGQRRGDPFNNGG